MDTENTMAATSRNKRILTVDNEDNSDDAPIPVTPAKGKDGIMDTGDNASGAKAMAAMRAEQDKKMAEIDTGNDSSGDEARTAEAARKMAERVADLKK